MKNIIRFTEFLQKALPSPFTIAVLLTYLTFLLAWFLTPAKNPELPRVAELSGFWAKGFWELLTFSMQMMLMLVLGYVLALTPPVNQLIARITGKINSGQSAVFLVAFFTILFSWVNWGLGLIFGAVFARKIAEHASAKGIAINYPLIGAAGYSGLMVWHGGLSGSAPLKITEQGHFLTEQMGVVPLTDTIFSQMNITVSITMLLLLPVLLWWVSKKVRNSEVNLKPVANQTEQIPEKTGGAEKMDYSRVFILVLAFVFLLTVFFIAQSAGNFRFVNLNFINFSLFALALLFSKNIAAFLKYVNQSIGAASGILIQFPLYAGIMGIMKYSGLFLVFTDAFVSVSNAVTLPVYTLFSAGIVNFFVPSGGGQWAVQGPVIVEAAQRLGVAIPKMVMALAYGDEWTNMLQPFWALPLLGITGLKAKEIVPYTFILFLAGGVIFILALLLF